MGYILQAQMLASPRFFGASSSTSTSSLADFAKDRVNEATIRAGYLPDAIHDQLKTVGPHSDAQLIAEHLRSTMHDLVQLNFESNQHGIAFNSLAHLVASEIDQKASRASDLANSHRTDANLDRSHAAQLQRQATELRAKSARATAQRSELVARRDDSSTRETPPSLCGVPLPTAEGRKLQRLAASAQKFELRAQKLEPKVAELNQRAAIRQHNATCAVAAVTKLRRVSSLVAAAIR